MDRFEDLAHTALSDPIGNNVRPQAQLGPTGKQLVGLVGRHYLLLDQNVSQHAVGNGGIDGHTLLAVSMFGDAQAVFQLLLVDQTAGDASSLKYRHKSLPLRCGLS